MSERESAHRRSLRLVPAVSPQALFLWALRNSRLESIVDGQRRDRDAY
jgi:hypothetical protein